MDRPTRDEMFRISVEGTLSDFIFTAKAYFNSSAVNGYTMDQFERLQKKWAEWPENPYRKKVKETVPPKKLKRYMVTFARLGSDPDFRGWVTIVTAPEMGATVAPIKKIVDEIFEDQYDIPQANIPVTLVENKGQLNYGLLGEFTVIEMPS